MHNEEKNIGAKEERGAVAERNKNLSKENIILVIYCWRWNDFIGLST